MAGQKTMFSLRNKRRLMKKSVNMNKYGPFFIIFPLPVMLKFTVHITAVHLFTCVAKAVTSRRSRELDWDQWSIRGPFPIPFCIPSISLRFSFSLKKMALEQKASLKQLLTKCVVPQTSWRMQHKFGTLTLKCSE